MKCESYENYLTIVKNYYFPNGEKYTGTNRYSYLPTIDESFEILGLLKFFFDLKLTFIIGNSITTGKSNTVVGSGIHHKTNLKGGIII